MSDEFSPVEEPRTDPRQLAGQKMMTLSDSFFDLLEKACIQDPSINTQIMHGALQYTLFRLEQTIIQMYSKETLERYKRSLAIIPKQDVKAFLDLDTTKVGKC